MKFLTRKRRHPPAIIIVSLIDILVVLLIFLMVTTTFKKQPVVQLALPESKQAKPGSAEQSPATVVIDRKAPFIYWEDRPITIERLQQELVAKAKKDPKLSLDIQADREAPWGEIIRVMDAAKAANVRVARAYTRSPGQP